METVVTGRHIQVSDRFRRHLDEKLSKVPQIAPRVQRVDVVVTHEANRRQAKACDRVEITCHVKGSVIRAEACADDKYASLDVALDKLLERLRRASDRRKVQRRGRHVPESVAQATARLPREGLTSLPDGEAQAEADDLGESPIEVREKVHSSAAMTLEQALAEMELVGHDFYLFHDIDTDRPSVVYRRRGWSYGVIHLELEEPPTAVAG
ncbi:MAG TPA: ribosome-associated translation inhibitor RaiA [Dermatophilaceae bacterium]|nr:ribosome-associated translation inhibitor RaiA [Dermatophilaceae bacterium]